MISFEIIDCPNPDIIGKHTYQFNEISLGRALSNHLVVFDEEVALIEINLNIKNNFLFANNNNPDLPIFVNDKKILGSKKIQIEDKIKIGKTIIKVLDFKDTLPEEKDLSVGLSNKIGKNPAYESLFRALENELLKIENIENDSKF